MFLIQQVNPYFGSNKAICNLNWRLNLYLKASRVHISMTASILMTAFFTEMPTDEK
jgi:hypothetical protein